MKPETTPKRFRRRALPQTAGVVASLLLLAGMVGAAGCGNKSESTGAPGGGTESSEDMMKRMREGQRKQGMPQGTGPGGAPAGSPPGPAPGSGR